MNSGLNFLVKIIGFGRRHIWNENPVLLTGQVSLGRNFPFSRPSSICKMGVCVGCVWGDTCQHIVERIKRCKMSIMSLVHSQPSVNGSHFLMPSLQLTGFLSDYVPRPPICSGLPGIQGCHWHPDFLGTFPWKACGDCGMMSSQEAALCTLISRRLQLEVVSV